MPYKDPEKKRSYMRRYNAEYDFAAWKARNPEAHERIKQRERDRQVEKRDEISARKRDRYANDSKVRAMHRNYYAAYRARLRAQRCDCCTNEELLVFYEDAQARTLDTGVPHEVDHIDPISNGGPHCAKNLRVVTRDENRRKGSKVGA